VRFVHAKDDKEAAFLFLQEREGREGGKGKRRPSVVSPAARGRRNEDNFSASVRTEVCHHTSMR